MTVILLLAESEDHHLSRGGSINAALYSLALCSVNYHGWFLTVFIHRCRQLKAWIGFELGLCE